MGRFLGGANIISRAGINQKENTASEKRAGAVEPRPEVFLGRSAPPERFNGNAKAMGQTPISEARIELEAKGFWDAISKAIESGIPVNAKRGIPEGCGITYVFRNSEDPDRGYYAFPKFLEDFAQITKYDFSRSGRPLINGMTAKVVDAFEEFLWERGIRFRNDMR